MSHEVTLQMQLPGLPQDLILGLGRWPYSWQSDFVQIYLVLKELIDFKTYLDCEEAKEHLYHHSNLAEDRQLDHGPFHDPAVGLGPCGFELPLGLGPLPCAWASGWGRFVVVDLVLSP